jgi:hypothetical protein
MWLEPITDRTATDIADRTSKAFFNVIDWLRIYGNATIVNAIANVVLGTEIAFYTNVIEPTITTIPSVADLNILLANIERVRIVFGLPAVTGLTELKTYWLGGANADAPDYLNVNDWEHNVQLLRDLLRIIANHRISCGVPNVGQSRLWQHRFRLFAWVPEAGSPVLRTRTGIGRAGVDLIRNNMFRRYS